MKIIIRNLLLIALIITYPLTATASQKTGKVKWFNTTIGFGYIQPTDGGGKVFVHFSVIEGMPKKLVSGQSVVYKAVKEDDQWKATQVKAVK